MAQDNEIYGIGDVAIKLIMQVDKEDLSRLDVSKDRNLSVDIETRDRILKKAKNIKKDIKIKSDTFYVMKTLNSLGVKTSMTCKIGMDEFGMICQSELEKTSIDIDSKIGFGCTDSCLEFITPDQRSTKIWHRGISRNINYKEVDVLKAKSAKAILIEESMLNNASRRRAARFAARICKENGGKMIFDMNSLDVMLDDKETVEEMMAFADVVIAPHDQIYLLAESNGKQEIADKLKKDGDILIIKERKGFNFKQDDDTFFVDRPDGGTEHAEQYFTAGIIFGTIMEYRLRDTGRIASYLSSRKIVDDSILDDLNEMFRGRDKNER
ncbi:MAG: carbohydrate kinase family protein [Candidatus Woesearchaeota archaeon]